MIYYKKSVFLALNILLLQCSLFASVYQAKQLDISTLAQWSERCLKELIEFSSGGNKVTTFLAKDEFEHAMKEFIRSSKLTMENQKNWLENNVPPASLFESDKRLNLVHAGYGIYNPVHPFVQKLVITRDSYVCFIGDLHGSVHSLLRNLWRLVALGWIGNDFELTNKKLYIIFNGDFVDRGAYGIEVIYTLLRLKLANWDNVFLLRGNHEDVGISTSYGFSEEVKKKYPIDESVLWKNLILRFYELLPFALYLGSGSPVNFVQCSHGGIETGYKPKQLFDSSEAIFERIPDEVTASCCPDESYKGNNYAGFNWSDFVQDTNGKINFNLARGSIGYVADPAATRAFLHERGFKAFFRGHQDRSFGFKMLFESQEKLIEKTEELRRNKIVLDIGSYKKGPFYWKYVVSLDDLKSFIINKYVPIFTFTSAAEGQAVPYDCFGILKLENRYEDWTLTPHEYSLENNPVEQKSSNRHEKNHSYLWLQGDLVSASFFNPDHRHGDEKNLTARDLAGIDRKLIDKAHKNQIERLEAEVLQGKIARIHKRLSEFKDKILILHQALDALRKGLHGK